jgi:amino acid efflux transporter
MNEGSSSPGIGRLTTMQGTALYVSAVLGTGVITLPAIAAGIAGPASLLAWLLLAVVSAPLATTFAALGARYGDAGGVSTYVRRAFGARLAAVVGWCFYLAVPPGTAAAAIFCGFYVESAVGGGDTTVFVTAALLVVTATVTNVVGLKLVGPVQLMLSGLLCTLLVLAIATSLPRATITNLQPFTPHGWLAVGPAAAALVWSFVGWEAITHLTGEFRNPKRDVQRATWAAITVVGSLYLLLAFAVVAVLGPAASRSEAPLSELMALSLGDQARPLAAGAAILLTLGSITVYIAGAAKLGSALGSHGALPVWLARGSEAGQVPRRSLSVVTALTFLALLAVAATSIGTRPLLLLTNSSLVLVYVLGTAAAARLLPRRTNGHRAAMLSFVAVVLLLIVSGRYLFWPIGVASFALVYLRFQQRRKPAAADHRVDEVELDNKPG